MAVAVGVELFTANLATTTVSSGGTTSPASGTQETWTVASSTGFPASVTGLSQFHVSDPALVSEMIAVINVSGTTWTVIRGAENTTPVAHSAGLTVNQVATTGALTQLRSTDWLNVVTQFGADPTGTSDSTTVIQDALTAAAGSANGLTVYVPAGVYLISQTLQIGSNTTLMGAGTGASTIRTKASSLSGFTQVGSNTGSPMIATTGNAAKSRITVTSLTLDGNQANAGTLAGYADAPECAPVGIWSSSLVSINNVEVINAIGYSVYLNGCTDTGVTRCRVLSGAASALGTNQQDGIHFTNCSEFRAENNDVDTGTGTAGDDGIAVESYTGSSNGVIAGNMVRAAAHGIVLAAEGGAISQVTISGNTIYAAEAGGIVAYYGSGTVTAVTNLTIAGNTMTNLATSGSSAPGIGVLLPFTGVAISGNTMSAWNNTGSTAILVSNGTGSGTTKDLVISGNTIGASAITQGIYVGFHGAGVTDYSITGNVVDISSGTAGSTGIASIDSPDGVIAGNMVFGSTQASSIGIEIYGQTTAPIGISVTGNRVKAWATGIEEFNSGAQPNYIVYTGNNCHGCTAFITTSGGNDVTGNNVVA
jgi:Pectate lyase superfamily protein